MALRIAGRRVDDLPARSVRTRARNSVSCERAAAWSRIGLTPEASGRSSRPNHGLTTVVICGTGRGPGGESARAERGNEVFRDARRADSRGKLLAETALELPRSGRSFAARSCPHGTVREGGPYESHSRRDRARGDGPQWRTLQVCAATPMGSSAIADATRMASTRIPTVAPVCASLSIHEHAKSAARVANGEISLTVLVKRAVTAF